MILHEHTILGAETEVTLCPLGDIQWAGDRYDLTFDRLNQHIAWTLKQPTPRYIGPGDYIDFASPSNREKLAGVGLYDTAIKVIKAGAKGLVDGLYQEILKPTAGKWLSLVNGHHHFSTAEDGDSDQYLAHLLGAAFAQDVVYGKIRWVEKKKTVGTVKYVLFHGDGHSVFPWGPLNKLYRISPNFTADLMFMGHQTKKAIGEYDRMDWPDEGPDRLEHRTVHLVGTGGWTKGYIPGRTTYISKAMLPPVALGAPVVHIRPHYHHSSSANVTIWEPGITVEA